MASEGPSEAEKAAEAPAGQIRMIEFFSGIGGMRCAVEWALSESSFPPPGEREGVASSPPPPSPLWSCVAYEISLHANMTYAHNFAGAGSGGEGGDFSVRTKLIEQLRPSDVDGKSDLWTLSPPCQPFTNTRLARRRDGADRRCDGLKAITSLLTEITEKPRWILLENVRGFVGSEMLGMWYDCLESNGFSWEEYLLSPVQVGVPNSRTRYYMIAERSGRFRIGGVDERGRCSRGDAILCGVPGARSDGNSVLEDARTVDAYKNSAEGEVLPLSSFVQTFGPDEVGLYLLPEDALRSDWAKDLPVVTPLDRMTHCFTAAYGRIAHRATGSLLLQDDSHPGPISEHPVERSDMAQYAGKLRRFAPEELLALFGFPSGFHFPDGMGLEHRYKLVGNSVSVFVVARVAAELLQDCCRHGDAEDGDGG